MKHTVTDRCFDALETVASLDASELLLAVGTAIAAFLAMHPLIGYASAAYDLALSMWEVHLGSGIVALVVLAGSMSERFWPVAVMAVVPVCLADTILNLPP